MILRTEVKEKVELGADGFEKIQAVTKQTFTLVAVKDAQQQQQTARLQRPTTIEQTSYQFSMEQQKSQMKGQIQIGQPLNARQARQQAQQPEQHQANRDQQPSQSHSGPSMGNFLLLTTFFK